MNDAFPKLQNVDLLLQRAKSGESFERHEVLRLIAAYLELQRLFIRLDDLVHNASQIIASALDPTELPPIPEVKRRR